MGSNGKHFETRVLFLKTSVTFIAHPLLIRCTQILAPQMNSSSSGTDGLAPQMRVVHFGKLLKKSSAASSAVYYERWCVLTYGIWCYFTSHTKAKRSFLVCSYRYRFTENNTVSMLIIHRFLDTLPWSNSSNQLTTKEQHRVS